MEVGPVLSAIADPTRRAVLESVRRGPRSVGEIAAAFSVSRPAISQHLRVLEKARLVRRHRTGRQNFYALDVTGLTILRTYLDSFWSDVLAAFHRAATAESRKKKGDLG